MEFLYCKYFRYSMVQHAAGWRWTFSQSGMNEPPGGAPQLLVCTLLPTSWRSLTAPPLHPAPHFLGTVMWEAILKVIFKGNVAKKLIILIEILIEGMGSSQKLYTKVKQSPIKNKIFKNHASPVFPCNCVRHSSLTRCMPRAGYIWARVCSSLSLTAEDNTHRTHLRNGRARVSSDCLYSFRIKYWVLLIQGLIHVTHISLLCLQNTGQIHL